jgi:hypothetical protein
MKELLFQRLDMSRRMQCCGSESGSGSIGSVCFWASYIRIRIHQLVVLIKIRNRINIGIRILITSSKNKKKTINSY